MTSKPASSDSPDEASDTLEDVLDKLGEIVRAARNGSFVFRGEPKPYPEISSSLYRQYKTILEPFGVDGFDIRHVQDEVVSEAARYTGDPSHLNLLSQLQHFGYPTNLIDFTTDYLIALFFACASESRFDGRVILLSTETNLLFRMQSPANRIKAQKSVFINPPSEVVNADRMICIPHKLKLPILEYLRVNHDISAQTIYDDIHGFIRNANTHRSAYAEFHIGGLHLQQGNLKEALEHFNRSIALNGYATATLVNRAATLQRMKKPQEAIRDLSQVIALDHEDARAYRDRGRIYFDIGQEDLAEKDYSEAIRLDNEMEDAYIGHAACLVYRGDIDGAIDDLNLVIDQCPMNSTAYNGRGIAYAAAGNFEAALKDVGTAVEIDPTVSDYYMFRAQISLNVEDFQGAIKDLGVYLALDGEDPPKGYFLRGIALIALGNFDEGRADLKTALEQDSLVAQRVIASVSDVVDGSESLVLPDEMPPDISEMLKPPE